MALTKTETVVEVIPETPTTQLHLVRRDSTAKAMTGKVKEDKILLVFYNICKTVLKEWRKLR